jgi:hypothetical protein
MAADDPDCLLFSYGSLQQEQVQIANFGRRLEGEADRAVGYKSVAVTIDDPATIAISGTDQHWIMIATGDPGDFVAGTIFRISAAELAAADGYEPGGYVRVALPLSSGRTAWAYVKG